MQAALPRPSHGYRCAPRLMHLLCQNDSGRSFWKRHRRLNGTDPLASQSIPAIIGGEYSHLSTTPFTEPLDATTSANLGLVSDIETDAHAIN
jgi:hypothetical protein